MGLMLTDAVLSGILLLSLLVGVWRGLVHELMSLAGWVIAFFLAQWLAQDVAHWLPVWREAAAQVRYALSFVLVFVASLFVTAWVAWLLGKLVATAGMRPVDRSLGGMFGLVRGVVLLLVLAVVVHLTGMRGEPWWNQSRMTPVLELLLAGVKPVLPLALQSYLP